MAMSFEAVPTCDKFRIIEDLEMLPIYQRFTVSYRRFVPYEPRPRAGLQWSKMYSLIVLDYMIAVRRST